MSLVSDSIGNFIGGVSQQPDKMMFANQSKKLENFLLNPSVGLVKRPPTEHIAKLNSSTPTNIFTWLMRHNTSNLLMVFKQR